MLDIVQNKDALRDRIYELEEILGISAPATSEYRALGLSLIQRRMLGVLMRRDEVAREHLFCAVYGDRPEDRQPRTGIIDVHLVAIRKSLRASGAEITSLRNEGWMIKPAHKLRLKEWLAVQKGMT